MTESRSATTAPDPTAGLSSEVAAAAAATPGVARLVPGLRGALARLRRPDAKSNAGGTGVATGTDDGVTVAQDVGGIQVVIDIGVHADANVIDTACAVRSAAEDVVSKAHPGPSTVRVNVLTREPKQPLGP